MALKEPLRESQREPLREIVRGSVSGIAAAIVLALIPMLAISAMVYAARNLPRNEVGVVMASAVLVTVFDIFLTKGHLRLPPTRPRFFSSLAATPARFAMPDFTGPIRSSASTRSRCGCGILRRPA